MAKTEKIIPMRMVYNTQWGGGIADTSAPAKKYAHSSQWYRLEYIDFGDLEDDFAELCFTDRLSMHVDVNFALKLKKGEWVHVFFDGRRLQPNAIAFVSDNHFHLPMFPCNQVDIDNFARRFFPCVADRVRFCLELRRALANLGEKPTFNISQNLKMFLAHTDHAECVKNIKQR